MIEMNNWMIEASSAVVLGFSGENESKELKIMCDDLKADATYYLDIESAERKNIALMTAADNTLSILLTSDMLGGSGRKRMQIREVRGSVVTKSNVFIGEVNTSVNAVEAYSRLPPSEFEQYETQMSDLSKLVEELKNHPGTGGGSGAPGEKGDKGDPGADGVDGKSAYELAVENGFNGSMSEWLASLKGAKGDKGDRGEQGIKGEKGDKGDTGEKGADGVNGKDGKDGLNGENGKSAYELAVDNGFSGTLAEWLNSLKGADGAKGDKGDKGDTGAQGLKGDKGDSGVEQQIVIGSAVTSYAIKPNILYVFPELSQLDVSFDLTDLNPNIVNDFHFQFVNGSTPCELSFAENVNVNVGNYEPQANGVCEISIVNGLMSYQNWSNE